MQQRRGREGEKQKEREREIELDLFTVPSCVHLSIQLASSILSVLVRIKIEMANGLKHVIFHMVLFSKVITKMIYHIFIFRKVLIVLFPLKWYTICLF